MYYELNILEQDKIHVLYSINIATHYIVILHYRTSLLIQFQNNKWERKEKSCSRLCGFIMVTFCFVREKYGSESVDVESGKKENRKWNMLSISMADFLNRYKTEDIYMVNDVSPKMAGMCCKFRIIMFTMRPITLTYL